MQSDLPEDVGSKAGRVPAAVWKAGHVVAGVLLPVACFTLNGYLEMPEWQSGRASDLARLLIGFDVAMIFWPLLLYSMTSMVLLVFGYERFSRRFAVRLGVYAGVWLALQYGAVMPLSHPGMFMVVGSPFFLPWFLPTIVVVPVALRAVLLWIDRTSRWNRKAALLFWNLPVLLAAAVSAGVMIDRGVLLVVLVGTLAAGPYWTALSYLLMSWRVWKDSPGVVAGWKGKAAGIGAWLAAYVATWKLSLDRTAEIYAALPAQSPDDCYVCTAAARGHPWLVKSAAVAARGGGTMLVNDQMRVLKCAEIALGALWPGGHRALRGIYDLLGRPLARMLILPILADAAYLTLKPFEISAGIALSAMGLDLGRVTEKPCRE